MKAPKSKQNKAKRAYMCGVSWQHELGATNVELFESPESCRASMGCSGECGVVEVEVRLKKWVQEQNMTGLFEKGGTP